MENKITSKTYDGHILSQGIQFQIDNYYEPKEVYAQRRIKIVIDALNPGSKEKILDIGCGAGTFAFHCAKMGAKAVGIDYSEESILMAQKICGMYGMHENPEFIIGNAMGLPFEDAAFDKIVSADFIEHITHEEKGILLKEIYRVIQPNGNIVIFTPNGTREKIGEIYWKLRNKIFGDKIPSTDLHFGLINKPDFEKLLKKINFNFELRYEDITRPYLAKLPLLSRFLALNLLWIIKKK